MNKIRVCLLLALSFSIFSLEARANILSDLGDDLASPVTTPALTPLLVGAGLTTFFILTKSEISHPLEQSVAEHQPLGKFSKYGKWAGQLGPNLIYAGGQLVAAAFGNENGLTRADQMFFASLYSGLLTDGLKYTVREPRPYDGTVRTSFPSGHSTTAFAFAAVVGEEHGVYWGIPAYALATFTAFSRMNDNQHYLQDVVGGATIGMAYGLGIHYLRRHEGEAEHKSALEWNILPNDDLKGATMTAGMTF